MLPTSILSLRIFTLVFALSLFSLVGGQAALADDTPAYQATTANLEISDNELALRLVPMTQDELAVETSAWMVLVKEQNVAAMEKKIAREEADKAEIEKLDNEMDRLLTESKALSEKFQVVLNAWEQKGGDQEKIDEYNKYLSVVYLERVKAADSTKLLEAAKNWLFSMEGGGIFAVKAAILVAAWLVLLILAKSVARAVRKATSKIQGISQLLADFLEKLARMATTVLGILLVLSIFGVDMGPLFALIGGASFIIAFAMQNTLSNFAAGLMIMIYQPFDVNDVVTLAGVTGKVKEMNLVSTTIVTPDNQQIIIPNNSAWGTIITNINRSDTRRIDLIFGIGYEDDMDKAQQILEDVTNNHPLVLKEPETVVQVHELADSSVNYICRPWAKTSDYWTVYWDITRQIKERFDAEGISIPYPQQDIHLLTQSSSESS